MKIIGISGSPRGRLSNTRKLVEDVVEGARSAGAEIEFVDLSDLTIDYCTACNMCHINGGCSKKDDIVPLHAKMLAADGLVLGSPVYFSSVTAQLKTLIDRFSDAIHCQMFLGKYACSVATAGGIEHDTATSYMNDILLRLGCTVVGAVGAAMAIPGSLEAAQDKATGLGKDLAQAINEHRQYPEQEAIHKTMQERFKHLITINKDNWPHEYEYWGGKGWL